MLRGRMSSAQGFLASNQDSARVIEFECANCGAASRTQPKRLRTLPAKVNAPGISSGIEEAGLLSCDGINGCLLRAFSQGAGDTGQSEIFGRSFSAGIERSDMVNVKTRPLAGLGEAAIFAAVARPLNHQSAQWGRNEHRLRRRVSSDVRRAIEATKESRPVRQALRPRAVRRSSTRVLHPVCRAGFGAVDARPLVGGSASNHRASQLKLESVVPYTVLSSAASLHESISGVQAEFAPSFSQT